MKILVMYNSRGGTTLTTAENIVSVASAMHHEVKVKTVDEVQSSHVEEADAMFVGAWVEGFVVFGVKPTGAETWIQALPSFMGKPVGVFCTYAVNPRGSLNKLSALLQEKNARVVDQHAFHRTHLGQDVDDFVKSVVNKSL